MRKGELIALKWGDIRFGSRNRDKNRYILVQRNWVRGKFTTPKNGNSRRVDLSRQLREVLIELHDERIAAAFLRGKASIADDLVFPSEVGTPIGADNLVHRYMKPSLEKAGLQNFRFHDLRHTFGSLLIQKGATLTYVKEQMGHSSIKITVDIYGHLVPGADIAWVDKLDAKPKKQSVAQAQPAASESEEEEQITQPAK